MAIIVVDFAFFDIADLELDVQILTGPNDGPFKSGIGDISTDFLTHGAEV